MRRLVSALPLLAALLLNGCSQADLPSWGAGTKSAPQAPAGPPPQQRPQVQLPALPPTPAPKVEALPAPNVPNYNAPLPNRLAGRDEVRAALLVPLSGPFAAWGQAMSNAAQLALFEIADQRLNLIPLDSKGTPEGAAAALAQAVAQGADIILGPIFAPEVRAAAPLARANGVPVVAFTTDRSALGPDVYTLGFLPSSQVRRVIVHAREQGKSRFALLARSDDYGRAVAEAFRNLVPALGGQVVKIDYYDPAARDVGAVVKRFTEVDSRTRGRNRKSSDPVTPPPFDAVMIPDEGTRLRSVASLVAYYEVDQDKVAFLGTMLWDDPRLAGEPSLQGGWFAAPPTDTYAEFERRYGEAFGVRPLRNGGLRASLAYDAVALAATLVRQNQDFSAASLTNPAGFAGIDGLFRLMPDGTSERGLAVREMARSGIVEIAPAPTSFGAPAM